MGFTRAFEVLSELLGDAMFTLSAEAVEYRGNVGKKITFSCMPFGDGRGTLQTEVADSLEELVDQVRKSVQERNFARESMTVDVM